MFKHYTNEQFQIFRQNKKWSKKNAILNLKAFAKKIISLHLQYVMVCMAVKTYMSFTKGN
jgi:hypothetical protein